MGEIQFVCKTVKTYLCLCDKVNPQHSKQAPSRVLWMYFARIYDVGCMHVTKL